MVLRIATDDRAQMACFVESLAQSTKNIAAVSGFADSAGRADYIEQARRCHSRRQLATPRNRSCLVVQWRLQAASGWGT